MHALAHTHTALMPWHFTTWNVFYKNNWTAMWSVYTIMFALAGVAVVECRPTNQKVAGSIHSLGHMPGLWARSPVGGT